MPTNDASQAPRAGDMKLRESGLVQRVRAFLKEAFPGITPHLVVGYSGGRDSLALLLVLRELRRLRACRLTAVHVDHGLRPGSASDAARAMQVARTLRIPCVLKTAPEDLRESHPGQSVEDVARRFRYQELAKVLNEAGGDAVAVGHHRQDQAETVLLHLLRGAGLAGLRGMAPDTTMEVSWTQDPGAGPSMALRVIRPFLHEDPAALDEIVRQSGVPVIADPTNAGPDFRRNRIRHELLPLMEDIAPGAAGRLVSLSDIVGEDEIALDNVASTAMCSSLLGESLVWRQLMYAPVGVQRRAVRLWLCELTEIEDLSRERVDAVVLLANRGVNDKRVDLGGGWKVRYGSGQLLIIRPE